MKKRIILMTAILLLFITVPTIAQQYQLNVGDKISISVWGHQDLSRETIIDPDGKISYPLVGSIKAEDKTTTEIRTELQQELAEYIIEPEVSVNLISYRKLRVTVMGAVRQEGSYEIRSDNQVLDVISLAGGIKEDAKAENTTLQRQGEKLEINLKELLRGNNLADNYQLQDGDQLFVPERERLTASIQGEVKAPGQYELNYEKEIRLNEFLAQAGSLTENAGEKIRLISDNKPLEFEVENTLAAKKEANPVVKDGDSIYIPSALEEVTILGEIARPGSYEWNDNMRLANLIARAGNTSDRANLESIRLVNANKEIREINMEDFFEDSDLTANPKLKPGDLVMVGEKNSVDWSRVFFLFSGFNEVKDFLDISW
ncbi:putative capsular polysaccharide transport protein [Halanaerobium saccharolyticum subsp. saccharolyticum DSM 6643]|uniref:Putative capsular polysaccharide transport protein n=1 Tax=Halanaerobium saccharolyticum subsp. saccharolyticum DSM 6643 TaxID=1293054 RepID=M5E3R5_9FIRM|nr:polysaccharide biosynthesis/export family protein [Halanaerobium saccharolyticum]CCU80870.1 putative capsular polysaccharide transport protein [Halanaerobium saccharolyticum subsp. saccharolyticum DSM 6643]